MATQYASAEAVVADLNLGTAASYSVLGAQTVTNTGSSVLSRSVGVSPGTAITGFPPGRVRPPGTINRGGAATAIAQADALIAFGDADLRTPPEQVPDDLVGQTVRPGLYTAAGPLALTGTVTLDGGGNPAAVFIFQSSSTLIVGSSSRVQLTNGAQACHVYWQVDDSSTIGTNTAFVGTILARQSISLATGATLQGRAIALTGAVTLQRNTITNGTCTSAPGSTSSSAPTSTSPTSTPPTSTPSTSTSTIGPTVTGPTGGPTGGPTAGPTGTSVTSPIGRTGPSVPTNPTSATGVSPTGGTSTASTTAAGGGIIPTTPTATFDSPQVPITPVGGVGTGGGSTTSSGSSFFSAMGALVLLLAAALVMAGLRRSRRG